MSSSLLAQEQFVVDSLLHVVNSTKKDETKVRTLIELSRIYGLSDFKTCIDYAQQALDAALETDDYILKAHAYNNMGVTFVEMADYDRATELLLRSKGLIEKNGDYRQLVGVVLNLGTVRFHLDDFNGALENFNYALELNNTLVEAGDSVYMNQIQIFYINIGSVYLKKGNYQAAIEYMNKALVAAEKWNDLVQLGKAANNLGEIYIYEEEYRLAREYLYKSLNYRILNKDKVGMARTYLNLTNYYLVLNSLDSAKSVNSLAIDLGQEMNILDILRDAYKYEVEINEKAGDYEKTVAALRHYHAAKDSLVNESVIEKTTRLRMQYEINRLEEEREEARFRTLLKYYVSLGFLFFAMLTFILLYFLLKNKAKRTETENELIQRDLEKKNKELTTNVMYLIKKNEFMLDISKRLNAIQNNLKEENRGIIKKVITDIQTATDNDTWKEFELRFQEVHNNFFTDLKKRFPTLTPGELKMCAFLRLNMTSKEISSITNQSIKSIEVTRSRIRKKLELTGTDENLVSFLSEF